MSNGHQIRKLIKKYEELEDDYSYYDYEYMKCLWERCQTRDFSQYCPECEEKGDDVDCIENEMYIVLDKIMALNPSNYMLKKYQYVFDQI